MSQSHAVFPSRGEGLGLHLDLCDLNPTAVADVCRAYVNPLLGWLAAKFPDVDPHLRETAAHDALLTYVKSPQSYEPAKSDLARYLCMAARGDLLNLLQRERKHHLGRVAWIAVEDDVEARNLLREDDPSLLLQHAEETQQWQATLQTIVEKFNEQERHVYELMLEGERKTGTYARVLGLDGLAAAEQEREVKKVKDRIKKRLERGDTGHA